MSQLQAFEIAAHVTYFSCKAPRFPGGIGDLNGPSSFTQAINNASGKNHSLLARLQRQLPTFLNWVQPAGLRCFSTGICWVAAEGGACQNVLSLRSEFWLMICVIRPNPWHVHGNLQLSQLVVTAQYLPFAFPQNGQFDLLNHNLFSGGIWFRIGFVNTIYKFQSSLR